jgi:hypothetical protein
VAFLSSKTFRRVATLLPLDRAKGDRGVLSHA